jgi:ketosteroid isomerase-like protein
MSQENVQIVRSILDAWNRRDYSAALALVAPDIRAEDYAFGGGLDATYEGIPGLQKWMARFWGSFVDFHTQIEEYIPVDDEVVLAAHHHGRGKASGVEVEMRNWHVVTVRNGKVVRYRIFQTKPEALEAVGLRE